MVSEAMLANHASAAADVKAAQSFAAKAVSEAKRIRRRIKRNESRARSLAPGVALQKASSVPERVNAVKSFETSDLGQGHPRGGTAEHTRNRSKVSERLRLRFPPLPSEQGNDWECFKPGWDKARHGRFHVDGTGAWGSQFRNEVLVLSERLQAGDVKALSRWMADQCREYLGAPALRVLAAVAGSVRKNSTFSRKWRISWFSQR